MITALPTIELAKLSQIDSARMVEAGNNAMKIRLTHPLPCHMSAPSSFKLCTRSRILGLLYQLQFLEGTRHQAS